MKSTRQMVIIRAGSSACLPETFDKRKIASKKIHHLSSRNFKYFRCRLTSDKSKKKAIGHACLARLIRLEFRFVDIPDFSKSPMGRG